MKKELKQFKISREGFNQLNEYDFELLEKARSVVMWYLEASYGRTSEKKELSLKEAALWCGFKVSSDKDGIIIMEIAGLSASDVNFYKNLYLKFKNFLETFKINENDELGLIDEIIQVSNTMLKYKYIIALKRKKKGFFDKVKQILFPYGN